MSNYRLLMLVGVSVASLFSGLLPAIAAPDLTYSGASTYKGAHLAVVGGVNLSYRDMGEEGIKTMINPIKSQLK